MNNKNIKTLTALKKKLKKTLPAKISSVMQSYDDFVSQPTPGDAKGFTAHHNACKSAVVHAETLLKLARWTDDDENIVPVSELSTEAKGTSDYRLAQLLEEAAIENECDTDEEEG